MNEPLHRHPNEVCLNNGVLASLHDGALTDEERLLAQHHLAGCPDCQALERLVDRRRQEMGHALALLDPPKLQIAEIELAFTRFQSRLDRAPSRDERGHARIIRLPGGSSRSLPQRQRPRLPRKLLAAVAVILLLLFTLPNASAWASAFLTLFQVQQVQPVTIDLPSWRQQVLQDLQHFGTLQIEQNAVAATTTLTPAQAEQVTRFPLQLPTHLPVDMAQNPHVNIIAGGQASFVFQQAKAAGYLAQLGDSGVAIPASLDGATFQVTFAPGAAIIYAGKTMVVLKEVPSPIVRGSSPSALATLQQFLLAVPRLPVELHDLLHHLNQASGTVPLPLPESVQTQAVTVQGATGLLMSEAGARGGIVIWLKGGIVYTLASLTTPQDALSIATSLHAGQ